MQMAEHSEETAPRSTSTLQEVEGAGAPQSTEADGGAPRNGSFSIQLTRPTIVRKKKGEEGPPPGLHLPGQNGGGRASTPRHRPPSNSISKISSGSQGSTQEGKSSAGESGLTIPGDSSNSGGGTPNQEVNNNILSGHHDHHDDLDEHLSVTLTSKHGGREEPDDMAEFGDSSGHLHPGIRAPSHCSSMGSQHGNPDREMLEAVFSETGSVMSGYSVYSYGHGKDDKEETLDYYVRLVLFYREYNPEKLDRVEEFLQSYKGEEEQLFASLRTKYGPEPEMPSEAERVKLAEGFGGSVHKVPVGQRILVPKVVTAAEGNTEYDTPFWPGSKGIGDRDLMDLLLDSSSQSNKHLVKCFLGELENHPTGQCWNGMTYMTASAIPTVVGFLGHTWSGSLASSKKLVFRGQTIDRLSWHCSDECVNERTTNAQHERWKLTMYQVHPPTPRHSPSISNRAGSTGRSDKVSPEPQPSSIQPQVLFRTVWDPVISAPSAAASPTRDDDDTKNGDHGGASNNQQQNQREGGFFAGFFNKKRQQPAQPVQPVQPLQPEVERKFVDPTTSQDSLVMQEDIEPSPVAPASPSMPENTLELFLTHLQATESRIMDKLEGMGQRLSVVEHEVNQLKQKSSSTQQ